MTSKFHGRKIDPPDTPSIRRQPPATQEIKDLAYGYRSRGASWRQIGRRLGYTENSVRAWIVKGPGDPLDPTKQN